MLIHAQSFTSTLLSRYMLKVIVILEKISRFKILTYFKSAKRKNIIQQIKSMLTECTRYVTLEKLMNQTRC